MLLFVGILKVHRTYNIPIIEYFPELHSAMQLIPINSVINKSNIIKTVSAIIKF